MKNTYVLPITPWSLSKDITSLVDVCLLIVPPYYQHYTLGQCKYLFTILELHMIHFNLTNH